MLAAAFRYAPRPPWVGAVGVRACRLVAVVLGVEANGGEDHVLPVGALLVAPSLDNARPRFGLGVLLLQHLPSHREQGAGSLSRRLLLG
jgi:hypothetical protein